MLMRMRAWQFPLTFHKPDRFLACSSDRSATAKEYLRSACTRSSFWLPSRAPPATFSASARTIMSMPMSFRAAALTSSAAAGAVPKHPIIFSKVPETVVATHTDVLINPSVSTAIDYEAELAVIIGKPGRGIARKDAFNHVWGYTIINDVTARDLQGRYSQWLIGKSQVTFCPMGPWAVTKDSFDLEAASVRCFVNGELRQNARFSQLIFDIPTIIAVLSEGVTLNAGDIIATGTPAGVGIGFDPPRYLRAGDEVRVEIEGIGVLENRFVNIN